MRWGVLGVDYEMYGKDHRPNADLYSEICKILDGVPPVQYFYELFLNEDGNKISKSKGNSITVDEWLQYAPEESMSLFIYQSPSKAKRLHFDVIPKNVDEYINLNKLYHAESDAQKRFANPLYHIHNGKVPVIELRGISFGLLLNLVSVCNAECKSVLWSFISRYAKDTTPENSPYLDHLVGFALNYYHDFIKTSKVYLAPSPKHKEILLKLITFLNDSPPDIKGEEIQKGIYALGRESGYENLRDFFKDIYQIILGQTDGPRLGSFIDLFGKENAIKLIQDKIS
jgi:lysyl-tRNA synthetase class 1